MFVGIGIVTDCIRSGLMVFFCMFSAISHGSKPEDVGTVKGTDNRHTAHPNSATRNNEFSTECAMAN